MPLAIFLKQPPLHVIARGSINKDFKQELIRLWSRGQPAADPVLEVISMEGKPIIIPGDNVAMVKEVRPEDIKKVEAKGDRLIQKPVFIPPRGKG